VFNVTFSNTSAISWRPVLVVEEAGVLGKKDRPWTIVIQSTNKYNKEIDRLQYTNKYNKEIDRQ